MMLGRKITIGSVSDARTDQGLGLGLGLFIRIPVALSNDQFAFAHKA